LRSSWKELESELGAVLHWLSRSEVVEMGFLGWANFAVVCLAMVGVGYGATFEEQFTAFSSDGYHVQVTPDGQEAKVVLDQVAGKNLQPLTLLPLQVK